MGVRVNGRYPHPFPNRVPIHEFNQDCIGKGDIEPPPPPRTLGPRLYAIQKGIDKASSEERQWLVQELTEGRIRTQRQVKAAAIRLGCTEDDVNQLRWTPSIVKDVTDLIRAKAVYATAEALPYQAELAKTEISSFKTVAQVGKVLEQGGVSVQNNMLIDKRNGGDDQSDATWFKTHQLRSMHLIGGTAVPQHDPEREPVEPETTIVGDNPEPEPDPEPTEPAE